MTDLELTDLQKIALSRLFDPRQKGSKKLSRELPDGTAEEVDIIVRVKGTVKKGHSSDKIVTASVPVWKLLALALDKVNESTLEALVKQAIAGDIDESKVKDRVNDAIDRLKLTAKKHTSGSITANLVETLVADLGAGAPQPKKKDDSLVEGTTKVVHTVKVDEKTGQASLF